MRDAFVKTVQSIAEEDPRVMLVVGDLGFGVVDRFRDALPRQFLNAGVAEQNMTGVAAGLAMSGHIVYTYSIANFPVFRCLEQIRNDVCYHNADVKVVSVGAGVAYGSLGPSHHATEDLAVMRALPNMTVLTPGDPVEAAWATRTAWSTPGPVYLRLGRAGESHVHDPGAEFELGRAFLVSEGRDATLLTAGSGLPDVIKAAQLLAARGIHCRVLSFPSIKPLDGDALRSASVETGALFTIEEHSVVGGFGSAVAEHLADVGSVPPIFQRLGFPNAFTSKVGDQGYLRSWYGIDAEGLARSVADRLERGARHD
jgi:transketolase